jgi:hypothetical protein
LVSKAVVSDRVIDIFADAGMKSPDISILSDEFRAEVRNLPQRKLALELLRELFGDDIKARARKNLVEARLFSEMLEEVIRRYQNGSIETAQVIAQLIELAKDMQAIHRRGEALGLSEDELAFYDALEVNDSAVKVLDDDTLGPSPASSSRPFGGTCRSTGPSRRTPGPSCGRSSSGSSASMATRPTSRRRPRRPYWSRPRRCAGTGRPEFSTSSQVTRHNPPLDPTRIREVASDRTMRGDIASRSRSEGPVGAIGNGLVHIWPGGYSEAQSVGRAISERRAFRVRKGAYSPLRCNRLTAP